MSQFLKFQNVYNKLQDDMGNQIPSETKVIRAVNNLMEELNTQYDLTTTKRTVDASIIPNGTAVEIDSLLDDDDFKRVGEINFPTDDDVGEPYFNFIDHETFKKHISDGHKINEYTTYFEDGIQYIKVNTMSQDDDAVTFSLTYFSRFHSITEAGTFQEKVLTATSESDELLVEKRFLKLVSKGSEKILWKQAMGQNGEVDSAKAENSYKSQLKRMGLDSSGVDLKRKHRKIKIRHPYR